MSLKNLQEIASLVTKNAKKNRYVELVDDGEEGPKYLRLMQGLGQKRWSTDEEAQMELYGNELGDKTFDMLKLRAKEQLINLIFQLDTAKQVKSSYDKAYFSACKNLLAGALLLARNRNNAGIGLLKIALESSRKCFFNDLALVALRLLRTYSSFSGSRKDYDKYNSLLKLTINIIEVENHAEELNQELIVDVVRAVEIKENWSQRVRENYIKLQELNKKFDTYSTRLNMYRVGIRYYDSINDYRSAIGLATECEQFLLSNPHLIQKVRLGEMNLQKLYGALHLRDYENGSEYADTCKSLFNAGTINWLIFLEYYFLLCLHTGNHKKATEVYRQVITHPAFKNYPPQNIEKWKIFEAFLVYVLPGALSLNRSFNVSKFINEVPLFSKDKAGYNLSIIIAQIILSLKTNDYSRVLDKAEALKLYASRYIRKDKNPRSYYFIKMLLVMIKYDFDAKKTEQISQKFYNKLKAAHLGEQTEIETLEVIPYDLLWPQILEMLRTNN